MAGWTKCGVYVDGGILFSLKKEGNSDTYCNMIEPWEHYLSEMSVTKWQILHDSTYERCLKESNS